eukprot:gene13240-13370_t
MKDKPQSAKGFIEDLTADAYAAAGKQKPGECKEHVPLVPIYIGIDRDNFATPQEPLREGNEVAFTGMLSDVLAGYKEWSTKPAASRFLLETSLPGNYEKLVEDQINAGLKPYNNWRPAPGKQLLVKLQLYVRLQDKVFRDEVLWDVGNPMNNADNYAIRVCEDLGLACDWYDVIRAYVSSRLEEIKQKPS